MNGCIVAALGVVLLLGCDRRGLRYAPPETQRDAAPTDAGPPIPAAEAGSALDADARLREPDVRVAPVRLGLLPVPRSGDAGVGPQLLADLDVIAAGSRAMSFVRRWDALFDGSQPIEPSWSELQSRVTPFRDAGGHILLTLAVVDGRTKASALGVAPSWSDPAQLVALRAAIDEIYARFGDELRYLAFGDRLGDYGDSPGDPEREALFGLLTAGFEYAAGHEARPPTTEIGLSASLVGISRADVELRRLLNLGDVTVASFVPLAEDGSALSVEGAIEELQVTLESQFGDAGRRRLVLQEVGYPTASLAASSQADQLSFFEAFFDVLSTRRWRVPLANIAALHDRPALACQAEVTAAYAANDELVASLCSLGVRTADGTPKQSWSRVLDALAFFHRP